MSRKRWPKGTWMRLRSVDILKAYMSEKHFSMSQLAGYAGCSKAFIGYLVKGTKTTCSVDLADRIANALGAPTEALFLPMASAGSGRPSYRQRMQQQKSAA